MDSSTGTRKSSWYHPEYLSDFEPDLKTYVTFSKTPPSTKFHENPLSCFMTGNGDIRGDNKLFLLQIIVDNLPQMCWHSSIMPSCNIRLPLHTTKSWILNTPIKISEQYQTKTLLLQWVKSSNLLTKTNYPKGSICFPEFLQATMLTARKLSHDSCQMYNSATIT
jgi:hypothetical protein